MALVVSGAYLPSINKLGTTIEHGKTSHPFALFFLIQRGIDEISQRYL